MIEVSLRFSESTGDAQKQAVQRQELLIAELNHRVRNILSLIRGLTTQSARSASDLSSYVGALNGRVQALARAHDQITKQNWGPAPLMSLFVDEMAAQSGDDPDRLILDGPAVLLMPRAVSTMALVIHELITNSIKYGALSKVGTVHVTAEPVSDGALVAMARARWAGSAIAGTPRLRVGDCREDGGFRFAGQDRNPFRLLRL